MFYTHLNRVFIPYLTYLLRNYTLMDLTKAKYSEYLHVVS